MKILTKEQISKILPKRPKDANKGTFGKVLVIAGSENYPGAAYLCCTAAYRIGAGLITLATIPVVQNIVSKKLPEVTFIILPEENGAIGEMALDAIYEKLKIDVMLIGPGLGRYEGTAKFIYNLLRSDIGDLNFVIDGDGLNILATIDDWDRLLENYGNNAVLTPHPREIARLTNLSVEEIQKNRVKVAQDYADKWGQVVVLKGANTVIASPGGEKKISPFANPALATAGTGDVLSGIIAGLLAQRVKPFDASCAGVYIHGMAGEVLREKIGDAGVLASDLLPIIPQVVRLIAHESSGY